MKTPKSALARAHKDRYIEAGLVQVSAWVPVEHKARLLAECKILRERYLAEATLKRLTETEPSTER
jgi:hypothetical protein